jgi:hypothetical protein
MFKSLLLSLVLFSACFAQIKANWYGLYDTSNVSTFKKDSLKFSKVFNLTDYENRVGLLLINDTTNAGIRRDSAKVEVGYRLGYIVLNSTGNIDTAWLGLRIKDTTNLLDSTRALSNTTRFLDTNYVPGYYDTTNVTGFAVAPLVFPAGIDWAPLIQWYAYALTGTKAGQFIRLRFAFPKRLGSKIN